MTFEEAENWEFNPFDLTKVINELRFLRLIWLDVQVSFKVIDQQYKCFRVVPSENVLFSNF